MGASLGSQVDANVLKPFQPLLRAQEKVLESAFLSFVVPGCFYSSAAICIFFWGNSALFLCSLFMFLFFSVHRSFFVFVFPLGDFLDLLSSTLMF